MLFMNDNKYQYHPLQIRKLSCRDVKAGSQILPQVHELLHSWRLQTQFSAGTWPHQHGAACHIRHLVTFLKSVAMLIATTILIPLNYMGICFLFQWDQVFGIAYNFHPPPNKCCICLREPKYDLFPHTAPSLGFINKKIIPKLPTEHTSVYAFCQNSILPKVPSFRSSLY